MSSRTTIENMSAVEANSSTVIAASAAVPFYLPGTAGRLCALYHPPSGQVNFGNFIYLHPFAQELHNTRPIVAFMLRELARRGIGVLQFDMFGCGNSEGDFSEARWETWREDVSLAVNWLKEETGLFTGLIGLRFGGLLAAQVAADFDECRLMLWQPVLSGEQMVTEFLRLREALSRAKLTTALGLRSQLAMGNPVEVFGYEYSPVLVMALDQLRLASPVPRAKSVAWLQFGSEPSTGAPLVIQQTVAEWRAENIPVELHPIPAKPFWIHSDREPSEYAGVAALVKRILSASV